MKRVKIDTFNPYENRFPNRKLVTRDTLLLIKYLRSDGYDVVIEPDNGLPIQYLYKKGVKEFFADPVNIMLINIPITILTNIISNQIQKFFDKKQSVNRENINITIDNSNKTYNYLGEHHPKNHKKLVAKKRKELKDGFNKCFEIKSPYEDLPTPVFLEHKPKIVGWCYLWSDNQGLKSKMIITDKVVKRRVSQNRLNGLSVTGIATKTECSICKSDFLNCEHIPAKKYKGQKCYNTIIETDYVETSIVKEPINSQCLINYK
ncbi:MAG: hypothetical protein RLZZ540_3011 [Bacteroidota bacterium]|jgi:hypothetical protein